MTIPRRGMRCAHPPGVKLLPMEASRQYGSGVSQSNREGEYLSGQPVMAAAIDAVMEYGRAWLRGSR